jgi:hypothetical protein
MGLALILSMAVALWKNPSGTIELFPLVLVVAGWSVERRHRRAVGWAFALLFVYCLMHSMAIVTAATIGFTPPGPGTAGPGTMRVTCTPGDEASVIGRLFVFGIWSTANLLMLSALLMKNFANSSAAEVPEQ